MEKYALSIGDGHAYIMCEGDRICDVDDFTVWQVESLITKVNQHKTLVAEIEKLNRSLKWIRIQYESNYEICELEGFDEAIYLYVKALTEKYNTEL